MEMAGSTDDMVAVSRSTVVIKAPGTGQGIIGFNPDQHLQAVWHLDLCQFFPQLGQDIDPLRVVERAAGYGLRV